MADSVNTNWLTISTFLFPVDTVCSLTNQNLFHIVPVGIPCFLLVEGVALSSVTGVALDVKDFSYILPHSNGKWRNPPVLA
jgi:hypothetical protein